MDSSSPEKSNEPVDENKSSRRPASNSWLLFAFLALFVVLMVHSVFSKVSEVDYRFFQDQLKEDNVAILEKHGLELHGTFKRRPDAPMRLDKKTGELEQPTDKDGNPKLLKKEFITKVPDSEQAQNEFEGLVAQSEVFEYKDRGERDNTFSLLLVMVVLPLLILFVVFMLFRRSRDQFFGGGFLSGFSKSPARRFEGSQQPITFAEVAGLESVKADLQEMVDFLKEPEKFERLGGRIPAGVLLMGPPGTGKTLLARAVAGEAGVPFFSVNGSEFIQMFVGVGASRVRDLFKTAKENAPAIVFVDEIDAVGRQRGAGLGGGHDEREQTLNQILSEMDGFAQHDTIIVLAATNRPDVLDPALLRPGRFDRHVTVDRPTLKGRLEIFKVHVREVLLDDDVDLKRMAAGTVGLTGADIRNVVNEAALWAARHDKSAVSMSDLEFARDKVLMGAKREEVLLEKEKEKTAFHEAGHALLTWITPGTDRVHKVTVIPRGRMLGATEILPEEDRLSVSESELHTRLVCLLGGRAAEELVFDEHTAGAAQDLEQATKIARRMVTQWGMSERLGPVNYKISDEDPFLGREMHQLREFSEHTMQVIDEEVAKILHAAADRAYQLLTDHRDKLDKLAQALVDHEELDFNEITEVIGPPVQTAHDEKELTRSEIAVGD